MLDATEYAIMMNEGALNSGSKPRYENPYEFGKGANWVSAIFNDNAPVMKHDLTISGASDQVNYALSAGYLSREGIEMAQLYTRDLVGSVVRPVKELKRFERVALAPGETKHLRFEVPVAELAFWNRDMQFVVELGDFQLWVAGDSASGSAHPFSVE